MTELLFISVFNYGGIEMAKNHLESLKRNNITNYIAYVTDDESYNELSIHNYKVSKYISSVDSINKEKNNFATPEFNDLSYIRYKIINDLLKQGKSVWYLDIDIVVLMNLNDYYNSLLKDFDIYLQNDINMLCTGCMIIIPNMITLQLTEFMYLNKNNKHNDQVFLNEILRFNPQVKFCALNYNRFPNGLLYFNELKEEPYFREAQENFNKSTEPVYLVHANYMVGIQSKIDAFKSKNLWFI